jgi:transcriptional regulator
MHNSDDQQNQNQKPRFRAVGARRESQKIWREQQVLKYASLGYNQVEIAEVLHISQAHVSRTLTAITKAAQEDIKHHIGETLPFERKKALMLFESVKRRAIDIANKENIGERDRIAALSLAKDATKEIWTLESEGRHIQSAIKVAGGLKEKLDSMMEESQAEEQEELQLYNHE